LSSLGGVGHSVSPHVAGVGSSGAPPPSASSSRGSRGSGLGGLIAKMGEGTARAEEASDSRSRDGSSPPSDSAQPDWFSC